ncbi:MAG: hypothetical protein ABIX28_15895 [Vicinamibacterales bacterium]
MRLIRLVVAAAIVGSSSVFTMSSQATAVRPAPAATAGRFELTVDSILKLFEDNLRLAKAGKATH